MSTWDAPDLADVQTAIEQLAAAKARLRQEELKLKLFEADQAKRAAPRNPTQRQYGVTDEDTEVWKTLQQQLAEAQIEVDKWSLTLRFYEFQKDMYIAQLYHQRSRLL